MKKKAFFFVFILLCFMSNVRGAGLQEAPPFATHGIFIFLDDTERDFGTITSCFFLALDQKAGPLLFSGSLMRNILAQPSSLDTLINQSSSEEEKKNLTELLHHVEHLIDQLRQVIIQVPQTIKEQKALVTKINSTIQPSDNLKKFLESADKRTLTAVILEISRINPQDWLLKKVNANLFLLIPKDWRPVALPVQFNGGKFTSTELSLGLKIDHLETITDSWIDYFKTYQSSATSESIDYFVPALPSIFISRAEFFQQMKKAAAQGESEKPFKMYPETNMPQWAVYLAGHGKVGSAIASLSLTSFIEFLDFLSTNIVAKIFVYMSCYGAGVNTELVYEDLHFNKFPPKTFEKRTARAFPFAIATAALTDAPVGYSRLKVPLYDFNPELIDFKKQRPSIIPSIHYKEFLSYVSSNDSISYEKALSLILPVTEEIKLQTQPQLKLPGVPWFNVVDSDQLLVNIGSILAKTRDKKKPLNVFNFFQKTNILAILLNAHVIPFELQINVPTSTFQNSPPLPYFVSMSPGNSIHLIYKISSATHSGRDILKSFTEALLGLDARKTFIIEEIQSTDYQGENSLRSVVIDMNKDVVSIFYRRDGIPYRLNSEFNEEKTASNYMDSYRKLIAEDPFLEEEKEAFKGIADIRKAIGKKAQGLKTGYKNLHPKKKKLTI